jgi:hypothetical protein
MTFDIIDIALKSLHGHEVNNDWTLHCDNGVAYLKDINANDGVRINCTPFFECDDGIPVEERSPEGGTYYDKVTVNYPQSVDEWNEFFEAYKNRYLLAIAKKYDRWYVTQKEIIMGHRVWEEVISEHVDDHGVVHIDGYTNTHEDDNGKVIAYIINGQVYYKDDRAKTDKHAQQVINEAVAKAPRITAKEHSVEAQLHPTWGYWIGATKVEVTNLDEARDWVEELYQLGADAGHDYSKLLHDFMFAVVADYQSYHNLPADNYSIVHSNESLTDEIHSTNDDG